MAAKVALEGGDGGVKRSFRSWSGDILGKF